MHLACGLTSTGLRSNIGGPLLSFLSAPQGTETESGQGTELSTGVFSQGIASRSSEFGLYSIS